MKKQPYYVTSTGIRIPRYKIKRMQCLPTEEDTCDVIFSQISPSNRLYYINNLNLYPNGKEALRSGEIIDVTDWKECGKDEG